jgi:hypothetical protein
MAASSLHETLLSACRSGAETRVKEALQRGVSIDIRDEVQFAQLDVETVGFEALTATACRTLPCLQAGNSPLMLASQEGHSAVVKFLLSKSAPVDASNKVECVLVMQFGSVFATIGTGQDGNTALILAVLGDKLPVIELLLAGGASVNRCRPVSVVYPALCAFFPLSCWFCVTGWLERPNVGDNARK